jgi:glycosyltransferase involved in cell wall biosynthesis
VLDVQVEKRASVTVAKAGAWLSRFAACVVSCSWSGAKFHAGFGYRTDTMRVIPNGFDVETFRPDPSARESLRAELSLPPETPLIGMIARFARQKNHRAFLLAARALLDGAGEESAAHFVLCGNGIERSNPILAGWISELDLADRIHLLGALQDVRRVYAGVDVAASTSLSGEGFPLAVGEAMASGTPCVVSDVGDSALIVGDTGRVVAPDDPAGIAKAWRELLRMPFSERRSLGERARRRIEEHFPVSEMVRAYEALYREVARDARGRSRSPRRT